MNIRNILLKMYTKYPEMQVQDAVKLLYQSAFGGGHMISDVGKSLDRLCEEAAYGAHGDMEDAMPYESIGDGICRMHLSALEDGLRPDTLNQMFIWTAGNKTGTVERFERKLEFLLQCCRDGELPWPEDEVQEYLTVYKEQGYPAVSHSDIYRETYHPSYRVVDEKFARYYPVFLEIDRVLTRADHTAMGVFAAGGERMESADSQVGKPVVISIDGMCGAGKSTLGNLLTRVYDCNLFHMDDFFLRPEQRTPKRYAEAGGNVDYERFKEEVLDHLEDRDGVTYQIFDCSKQALGEWRHVPYKSLNIIEGSYSQHPYFGDIYDLKFFCGIDPEEQVRRIEQRNGAAMLEMFKSKWIPMENQYLEAFGIREKSIEVKELTGER